MKFLETLLGNPAVLTILVPGALWLLGLALNAGHTVLVDWTARHHSIGQQALAKLLGFVDTTLAAHASEISKDVEQAKRDELSPGVITQSELKAIASNEVKRITALAPDLVKLVGDEVGLVGDALLAWLTSLVTSKLVAQVQASPK